jgi:hypothetical protein
LKGHLYFCKMRYLLILLLVVAGCKSQTKNAANQLKETVKGNWFVLYPDDGLLTKEQEKIYAAIQDSLVDIKCQKLISLRADGNFVQLDTMDAKGSWATKGNEWVYINNGGEGFMDFKTTFVGVEEDRLTLMETIKVQDQSLKFIWHLLKLDTGNAAQLFLPTENKWRKKATSSENEIQLKERLMEMLRYYTIYFNLISDKASYFIPKRIILPVKLYQHAIGLKNWEEATNFQRLFYNEAEAKQAYAILEKGIADADFDDIADLKSYTKEYAAMFQKVALVLEKSLL